ncbi:Fic family protein [Streptomyces sp. MB22_4]|uniref:Fic family protein n=1 Tax=Streptomyces sp. MB22_4 TaxID=3383120 RepID=UPI0039A23483
MPAFAVPAFAVPAFGGRRPQAREPGLLASAVHRPRARMPGTAADKHLYEEAAALPHALAANHPLVDGDQRTAWLATAAFLALDGVGLAGVDHDATYALVIDVAAGGAGRRGPDRGAAGAVVT